MAELDDRVKCNICKLEMDADVFASHAALRHEDEVFALLSDDVIIERLSERVQP